MDRIGSDDDIANLGSEGVSKVSSPKGQASDGAMHEVHVL